MTESIASRRRARAIQRSRELGEPDFSSVRSGQPYQEPVAGVDRPLLYVTIALCVLGLSAVYSASANEAMDKFGNSFYFAMRQLFFMCLGFGVMMTVSRFSYRKWSRWAKPIALGVIGFLLYTMFNGVESYGAERWVSIFGIQFQPSEMGKLSVVLLLAQALSVPAERRRFTSWIINAGLIVVTLGLIFKQPSLSMTIILSVTSAVMLFLSGFPLWVLSVGGIGAAVAGGYKIMHTEYQWRRIEGWLNPWGYAQDQGYNLIQSYYAIGSGGLLGKGLGMSHQKLYYLPFQYTDFIFAVWAEEWGLIGAGFLIALFLTMLYRGYVIARDCKTPFGQFLAMGITLILTCQIAVNIGVATGVIPPTGVTLPLISYGGTSVFVTLTLIGILMNISRYRVTISRIYD